MKAEGRFHVIGRGHRGRKKSVRSSQAGMSCVDHPAKPWPLCKVVKNFSSFWETLRRTQNPERAKAHNYFALPHLRTAAAMISRFRASRDVSALTGLRTTTGSRFRVFPDTRVPPGPAKAVAALVSYFATALHIRPALARQPFGVRSRRCTAQACIGATAFERLLVRVG
jgi:hypothetical protein